MTKRGKRRAKKIKITRAKKSKRPPYLKASGHERLTSKIFFLAAILLVMFSIIMLFNPDITSFVVLDSGLSKVNYEMNESLSGQITLNLQPDDILSPDTRIEMSIGSGAEIPKCNTTVCPEVYICPNGEIIAWMFCNMSVYPPKCQNVTYFSGYSGYPEKECCYINQENCIGVESVLKNTGFEEEFVGNWYAAKTGSCFAGKDTYVRYNGLVSGRTDTTAASSTTTEEFARFTQSFYPVAVSSFGTSDTYKEASGSQQITTRAIEEFQDSLDFWIRYEIPASSATIERKGYYFELVVRSSGGRRLHYYFNLGKSLPADSLTDKYIVLPNPPHATWRNYVRNLYNDWIGKGFSETDLISSVELYSAGKRVSEGTTIVIYGQKVNWDDVVLKYDSSGSNDCVSRGKRCCVEGTGVGNYYGEQLNCSVGKCWDSCTDYFSMSLADFIEKSTSPLNKNWTHGRYRSGLGLLGGTGWGYGYCYETNDQNNLDCYGWTNEYIMKLGGGIGEYSIDVPKHNGSYSLFINVTYTNFLGMSWELDSVKKSFSVGAVAGGPSCPDSDYSFIYGNWSDWGACINGNQTRARVLYGTYTGSEACPSTKNNTETDVQSCVVCDSDWICEWQPCTLGETQDNVCVDLNYCEADYVSETRYCCVEDWQCGSWNSCEYGEQTRNCYDEANCDTEFNKPEEIRNCEKPFFVSLWWLWVTIVLVIVIVALIASKKISFKPKRAYRSSSMASSTGEYSELTNYIQQAFSYGASKEETRRKLLDAGWPSDAVERAFRAVGR